MREATGGKTGNGFPVSKNVALIMAEAAVRALRPDRGFASMTDQSPLGRAYRSLSWDLRPGPFQSIRGWAHAIPKDKLDAIITVLDGLRDGVSVPAVETGDRAVLSEGLRGRLIELVDEVKRHATSTASWRTVYGSVVDVIAGALGGVADHDPAVAAAADRLHAHLTAAFAGPEVGDSPYLADTPAHLDDLGVLLAAVGRPVGALDVCPSCGSVDRFVLRAGCSEDSVDPDRWHREVA